MQLLELYQECLQLLELAEAGQAFGNAVISGIQYAVTEGENATVGGLVQNVAAGATAGFAGGNGLDLVHQDWRNRFSNC